MSSGGLVHERLSRHAAAFPDDAAVVLGDLRLSYGELEARANRLARYLQDRGVGPDRVVAILLDRSIDMIVAVMATLKAGGAYMPLDVDHPDDRLARIIEESACGLAVAAGRHAARLPATLPRVVLDREAPAIAASLSSPPRSDAMPDHLAYVLFTSGSTGTPKGSMIPHRGLANLVDAQQDLYGAGRGSHILQFARFAFDAATWDIATALSVGATLYLMPVDALDDAEALGRALREQRITIAMLPPAILPLLDPVDLPDLKRLIVGGDVLSPTIAALWRDRVELVNAYGPTEASVCATCSRVTADRPPAIGRPIPGVAVHVLDEAWREVAPGEIGELHIAGEGLARGYLRQPALTAERFLPNPSGAPGSRRYRTGDLVQAGADGQLEFLGRADRQVKIRGFRIELGEVEAALARCDGVAQAAVTLIADGEGRKSLAAHIEAQAGHEPDREALIGQLRSRLPGYMIPAHFAAHERLPLTANGKIDRAALPDKAPLQAPAPARAPRTDIEQRLAAAWARAFKADRVGPGDDFFEMGGDSIMALRIVSQLRQRGIWLSVRHLYDHPTIAELAKVAELASDRVDEDRAEAPLTMTPIQCWFFDRELNNPNRFNQSCLLDCREPLDPDVLQRALDAILGHHDVFATRFEQRAEGWVPFVPGQASDFQLDRIDLGDIPDSRIADTLAGILDDLHRRIRILEGPVFCGALIDLGGSRGQRLYLVAHHLAIDLVSWRIVVEDIQTAYLAARGGRAIQLPPRTLSYRQWAAGLSDYPRSGQGRRELEFWRAREWPETDDFPLDHPGGRNVEGSAETIEGSFDPATTSAVLRGARGARVNDVLLTGLARAYAAWTGRRQLVVDLEGHGREEFFRGADVTRTVGWFTSIFPVALDMRHAADLGQLLASVSQTLSAIPNRGAGYGILRYRSDAALPVPCAPISFNYWGRLDDDISSGALFGFLGQDEGERRDPQNSRTHLLEVNCHVVADRLCFQIIYSRHLHRRESVAEFAAHLRTAMAELADLCRDRQPWDHMDLSLIEMEVEL
ncbi:MAG TPA: amino acid adenylation domain-containing protein [Allosphingosinicella sp.]